MALNDLETPKWPLFCVILPNLVALGANYASKWLKIEPYCPQHKCSPKNLAFSIDIMGIFGEVTDNECMYRHRLVKGDNLTDAKR